MIALLLAAVLAPSAPPAPPVPAPATMLARYARALAANPTPTVLSFEYAVDQTGPHNLEQTHRVFRSGNSERDELLSSDGKRLNPPAIHVFLGHRNRYAIEALAPRPEAYTFRFVGTVRSGHHLDEVFATKPRSPAAATVEQVTLDGVTALPVTIRFVTRAHGGSGTVAFGRVQKHWMATAAGATATSGKSLAIERITFSRYRFPTALAPSTFSKPRPLPSFRPTPL